VKYRISKRFQKQTRKIQDSKILAKIRNTIETIAQVNTISEISDLEPLQGFPGYYRIKFDYRYRIGIYWDGETIEVLQVGTREGFYKQFP
jgi:mRNA interferase RelE/StbE